MAHDEDLANRTRELIASEDGYTEQKMFGGVAESVSTKRALEPWAMPSAAFAGLPLDGRVLDVGCGPGALTAELARRASPGLITAVDPSEEFVAALRSR